MVIRGRKSGYGLGIGGREEDQILVVLEVFSILTVVVVDAQICCIGLHTHTHTHTHVQVKLGKSELDW